MKELFVLAECWGHYNGASQPNNPYAPTSGLGAAANRLVRRGLLVASTPETGGRGAYFMTKKGERVAENLQAILMVLK
jgi:hypothetical protein